MTHKEHSEDSPKIAICLFDWKYEEEEICQGSFKIESDFFVMMKSYCKERGII